MDRLTEAEISMVLDTYMYLNYTVSDETNLKDAIEYIDKRTNMNEVHPNEMSILRQAVTNPDIGELVIVNQSRNMGYDEGTNAITFRRPDENAVYVAYRGTYDGEWLDNGKGLTEEETIQQKRATDYFDSTVQSKLITKQDRVIITGHSKGGNKAQFVTMESEYGDYIDVCYSVDGQGHSNNAISNWKSRYGAEEYNLRTNKIYGINGENDFVSVLGTCIIPLSHIAYVRTGADCSDFVAYHDITRMFATYTADDMGNSVITYNGRKNPYVFARGELGDLVAGLSDDIMKLPDNRLDGNAATLMQVAEIAMGGRKTGINGERMHGEDAADFATTGLGRILRRVFFTQEGATFLAKFSQSEQLSKNFGIEDSVMVNYIKLKEHAEKFENISAYLETMIADMELAGLRLPFILEGSVVKKASIQGQIAKMYLSKEKLSRHGKLLSMIAQLYKSYDESLEIT